MKEIIAAVNAAEAVPTVENMNKAHKVMHAFKPIEPQQRKERFRHYAKLLASISSKMAANARRSVPRPVLNVVPPWMAKGVLGAGMSPDGIKDPILRKQYENAIAENKRNSEFWEEQDWLEHQRDIEIWHLAGDAALLFEKGDRGNAEIRQELKAQNLTDKLIDAVIEFRSSGPK